MTRNWQVDPVDAAYPLEERRESVTILPGGRAG